MPPAKRGRQPRLPSRSSASTTATDPGGSRGLLSVLRRKPTKRPGNAAVDVATDNGTRVTDEILLAIFSFLPEIADLVRCAATCRHWRRLVSGDAAFLCRNTWRRPGGRLSSPPMALGFFHHQSDEDGATTARFVFTPTAAQRFGLHQPQSLNALFEGLDGAADGMFASSRVVASRNGRVVVELRRGKRDRTLELCVCNPTTGDVQVLPRLAGKDGLGQYACAVITAEDLGAPRPAESFYFRIILLYNRRDFTASRSYSSDGDSWKGEDKVTGSQIIKNYMSQTRNGVVARGGSTVYWESGGGAVFGLHLDTLEAVISHLPGFLQVNANTLLGLTPEGRLCAVERELVRRNTGTGTGRQVFNINIHICARGRDGDDDSQKLRISWEKKEVIEVDELSMDALTHVNLLWFCEKSRVVFFTARYYLVAARSLRWELYAFGLDTKTIEKLESHVGVDHPWWDDPHGYEMDQAAYLASLAA